MKSIFTGMGAALFVIVFMRIQIEWRAILFGLMGSIPGAILGFHVVCIPVRSLAISRRIVSA